MFACSKAGAVKTENAFFIVRKANNGTYSLPYNFWPRKFVQISAIAEIVCGISLICTRLYLIPIVIKMLFDSGIILYMNTI